MCKIASDLGASLAREPDVEEDRDLGGREPRSIHARKGWSRPSSCAHRVRSPHMTKRVVESYWRTHHITAEALLVGSPTNFLL